MSRPGSFATGHALHRRQLSELLNDMSMDLEQFHETFFEESFEALDSMEASLLSLDVGAPDAENINTVFRVAHSIKGGAGMFGFTDVTEFTHVLETLLDQLRSDKLDVTEEISNHLLQSVDVMRELLTATQNDEAIDKERVDALRTQLEAASVQKGDKKPAAANPGASSGSTEPDRSGPPRWNIVFKPLPELLANGNDPVRIFAELARLGEIKVRAKAGLVPVLEELDPEQCLLSWEITLLGDAGREDIDEVFEWVEGECDLEIYREGEAVEAGSSAPATGDDVTAGQEAPATVEASANAAAPTADAPAKATTEATAPAVASTADNAGPAASKPAAKPAAQKANRGDSGSIRVSIDKIDELLNSVGEIVITQSMLTQLGSGMDGPEADHIQGALTQLERNVRELQESVMRVRMLPIGSVFSRFPRLVRDLSQRLGKQIELRMTGEQTELDKTVLEKIGDPLVHLIRNSIDHGIEMPDDRSAGGKSSSGTVHLNAFHKGGAITIEVIDDGKGLDKDKLLEKGKEKGLVNPNDTLTDDQVFDLIFQPGFSTAAETTDVSGRGVGMDVVRRNIQELGGTIELRSELGKGTKTSISLPLTLAIVDGQSVAVGDETYIVPLTTIVESLQLKDGMASELVGRGDVFSFRGTYLPIIRMHKVFDVEPRTTDLKEGLIMVVEGDGRQAGLFVDELLGQQQVVIKSMETNYQRIDGISGATILGDGSVALILDIPGMMRVAGERSSVERAA